MVSSCKNTNIIIMTNYSCQLANDINICDITVQAMDVINAVLEGYPKTKKELYVSESDGVH